MIDPQRYGMAAVDPYMLSLDILVERFCMVVGDVEGGGLVVAEKRGSTLDRQLEIAWLNLKVQGTRFMQATQIERRMQSLILRDKKANMESKWGQSKFSLESKWGQSKFS